MPAGATFNFTGLSACLGDNEDIPTEGGFVVTAPDRLRRASDRIPQAAKPQ